MSLIPVDAEYHYVQDTAPTSANAGDVWLDTSVNPPVAKIYADVGTGLEWLQDQSSDRIATNLDAKVSEAGRGVDWDPLTYTLTGGYVTGRNTDVFSVSGSGYLLSAVFTTGNNGGSASSVPVLKVDGSAIGQDDNGKSMSDLGSRTYGTADFYALEFEGPIPFDLSFTTRAGDGLGDGIEVYATYGLK